MQPFKEIKKDTLARAMKCHLREHEFERFCDSRTKEELLQIILDNISCVYKEKVINTGWMIDNFSDMFDAFNIIISGNAKIVDANCYSLGDSRPGIETHGNSLFKIWVCDNSCPTIRALDNSRPTISVYGSSQPVIQACGNSKPIIWACENSLPVILTCDDSRPAINAVDSSLPKIRTYDNSYSTIITGGISQPTVEIQSHHSCLWDLTAEQLYLRKGKFKIVEIEQHIKHKKMRLTIIELSLLNFKGHTISIPFSRNTLILGKNGSGKTTVYDAFLWLLFGKDSLGRTDYNIKPRLLDGSEIQKTNVSVLGRFDLDGEELTLERRFIEKWTKKRGSEEAEFTGNATEFAINGVSCNASNFKVKIDTIVNEDHFRLITSSTYFNALKWDKRRELLLKAEGEPTNEEVAADNEYFVKLLSYLNGKSLDDFRKELAAKKKPIKKELDEIPSRIDEAKKSIITKDWLTIETMLDTKKEELRSLENQLADENLRIQEENKEINTRLQNLYQEINDLERRKMEIESKHKLNYNRELSNLSSQKEQTRQAIGMADQELDRLMFNIESNTRSKEEVLGLLRKLGAQYEAIASGNITGEDRICPTCGQEFTSEYLNDRTAHLLEDINKKGEENDQVAKGYDKKIIESQGRIKEVETSRTRLQEKLAELERTIITHFVTSCNEDEEYKKVIKSIVSKKEDVELLSGSIVQPNDLSGVKERINSLKREIDSLNREMAEKTISDKAVERVSELEAMEKRLSSALASLEKTEMVAERFIHKKMDMMTERINALFSLVRWKMFESQINGGEKEICECEIDGVPFGSLNTAKKVNAGLDIADTFSRIYKAYAPIFCDNRESVTDLIDVESQVISLIVSPEHKVLTIKNQ